MKPFRVEIRRGHESFKGYDLYDTEVYEVEAMHAKSAINKAKKSIKFKYGWIAGIHVYQNNELIYSEGSFYRQ